jgi:outer membrane immunogenic protein
MHRLLVAAVLIACGSGAVGAADLRVKTPVAAPLSAPMWWGFYAGVHAGSAWGYFRSELTFPGPSDVGGNATFGGQIGYNWQAGRFVYGAEADISWIDIHARSTGARFDEDWMATLRARIGYTIEDYLLYLTGGVGFTRVETAVTGFGSDSAVRAGFTGGFGVEKRFAPSWSGRLEALFVDVPIRRYNNGTFITSGGSHNYVVRAGLNYHLFGQ